VKTVAIGAERGERRRSVELMSALEASDERRFAPEVEDCALGQGVFAEDVKVELDRVVYNAAQFADDQFDAIDALGLMFLGGFQNDGEDALGDGEFVHSFFLDGCPICVQSSIIFLQAREYQPGGRKRSSFTPTMNYTQ